MEPSQTILHGTCLSVGGQGVLILGDPGSGKSDLALRLIDQKGYGIARLPLPSILVADDQVVVKRQGNRLVASAPPVLRGKFEIRGLGIVDMAVQAKVNLKLVVQLRTHAKIERMPSAAVLKILGVSLPMTEIDPAADSAPARLRAAVGWLGGMV